MSCESIEVVCQPDSRDNRSEGLTRDAYSHLSRLSRPPGCCRTKKWPIIGLEAVRCIFNPPPPTRPERSPRNRSRLTRTKLQTVPMPVLIPLELIFCFWTAGEVLLQRWVRLRRKLEQGQLGGTGAWGKSPATHDWDVSRASFVYRPRGACMLILLFSQLLFCDNRKHVHARSRPTCRCEKPLVTLCR